MLNKSLVSEVVLRFILFIILIITEDAVPYHRTLQPEELWLYRYPHMQSYYSGQLMWITVFTVPFVVFAGFYIIRRNREDFIQSVLGVTLSIFVTACITNFIKLAVGRPRPDFLSRCFPEGIPDEVLLKNGDVSVCSGDTDTIIQGLKSFPSGHSSLSFTSLGFVSLYLAGKLHVFSKGRGQGWCFLCFICPLLWALMIAVSRTSDYHHHWQDVTVGSVIGLVVCYTCYRQVFPSLNKASCHLPYTHFPIVLDGHDSHIAQPLTPTTPHDSLRDTTMKIDAKII